ncbi:YceI family protein [Fertoeibacter niger]|uniref:YceI family protein n=1 Tax=Fertoeibacter niger TaxID=2656921 RepID=UPI001C2D9EBE
MIGRTIAMLALLAGMGAQPAIAQGASDAPAGNYALDLAHGRLLFRVNHLGFSRYTALFTRFDAALVFDPAAPESMSVTATVDTASLETHYPDASFDFNAILTGPDFLDAAAFPQITFASTAVKQTGPQTADVTGDLTLRGVTKPVTLNVTFNGGYAGHPLDAGARIGFSAEGSLLRSDFGLTAGIPAPGTTMGVGDRVEVMIEAEFLNPDAPKVLE